MCYARARAPSSHPPFPFSLNVEETSSNNIDIWLTTISAVGIRCVSSGRDYLSISFKSQSISNFANSQIHHTTPCNFPTLSSATYELCISIPKDHSQAKQTNQLLPKVLCRLEHSLVHYFSLARNRCRFPD